MLMVAGVVVLLYLDYRIAAAAVRERLLAGGQAMAAYVGDGGTTEAPRQMTLNGAKLFFAVSLTRDPPASVLRWYGERYAGNQDALGVLAAELKRYRLLPAASTALAQSSFGDENRGGFAALDFGRKLSPVELGRELLHLGTGGADGATRFRYLYYERLRGEGTRLLTIWTEDGFRLSKLLAKPGEDAPGSDLENVPRYPGSLRLLSAAERGHAHQMIVYEIHAASEAVEGFYAARMPTLGWRLDPRFGDIGRQRGVLALRFTHASGREAVVTVANERQGALACVIVR
jgi:hypothetical protein